MNIDVFRLVNHEDKLKDVFFFNIPHYDFRIGAYIKDKTTGKKKFQRLSVVNPLYEHLKALFIKRRTTIATHPVVGKVTIVDKVTGRYIRGSSFLELLVTTGKTKDDIKSWFSHHSGTFSFSYSKGTPITIPVAIPPNNASEEEIE